jgi:hypothetical protein
LERQRTVDKDHDFGQTYLDVISDYREQPKTNEEILTFYSMDPSHASFDNPVELTDATPSTAVTADKETLLHEPPHRPRRMIRCGRTGEFYGYRDRIPSTVDMDMHPQEYWWSNANLGRPAIAHDMGENLTVISRAIKVTVVPSSFFASHRDIQVFPEYMELCKGHCPSQGTILPPVFEAPGISETSSKVTGQQPPRLIILKIKMGDQVMVSLNEVINESEFDRIFRIENRDELLRHKFKFILSPINSPLPIPAKKPKDAETVGQYFGMDNVDYYIDSSFEGIKVVSILINIYSKWVIRKFLPVATSPGRICDFILLSSDEKIVYADFRLLATDVSRALIKGNVPK